MLLSQNYFDENFIKISDSNFLFIDNGEVDKDDYNISKVVSIVGHSQGDYSAVIVPTNLGYERGFNFEEYFTNLFYNCPLYCRITVDGEEYYLDEELGYDYDTDKIEEVAFKLIKHDRKDEIISWLSAHLPNQPKYL
jgi:hypothetical protein